MAAPRDAGQRKNDTLTRLTSDVDVWIATADAAGDSYLVPLSFFRGGRVRVGLGELRDVTMIDGTAELVANERTKDGFAAKHAWDPRKESGSAE